MDDFERIFDGQEPAAVEAQPEPVASEVAAPQPAAPEAPAVAAEPAPIAEAQPREDDGRFAPISALQEERRKRQELERTVEEMRKASQPKPQPVEPAKLPDPYDDPQGYARAIETQTQEGLLQMRFQMSNEMARAQFGADEVETARQWAVERAASDPAFDLAISRQPHPMAWIVQQHKRDGLLSQIGEDPDAYVRRRAAELGLTAVPAAVPAAVAPQPAPVAVTPPRSLVSAPAAGGAGVKDVPTGPMTALDAAFK